MVLCDGSNQLAWRQMAKTGHIWATQLARTADGSDCPPSPYLHPFFALSRRESLCLLVVPLPLSSTLVIPLCSRPMSWNQGQLSSSPPPPSPVFLFHQNCFSCPDEVTLATQKQVSRAPGRLSTTSPLLILSPSCSMPSLFRSLSARFRRPVPAARMPPQQPRFDPKKQVCCKVLLLDGSDLNVLVSVSYPPGGAVN